MIAIGCDHGGLNIKNAIIEYFKKQGIEYNDVGTYTEDSVDYPVYSYKVATEVANQNADKGIICCGTGIGVSIVANKVKGIRAALCTDEYMAEKTRQHNNANMLCLGGRVISEDKAVSIAKTFLNTEFEGGRHQRRIDMISDIENNNFNI